MRTRREAGGADQLPLGLSPMLEKTEGELLPEAPKKPSNLFQKGQSGNPAGRPSGSKNKISLLKVTLEEGLRTRQVDRLPGIVDKILSMAEAGDKEMCKLVWNSWISKTATSEDEAPKERISIVIGKLDQVPEVRTGKTLTKEEK